jgi:DNA-binding transcriptional LysR family regulator
MHDHLSALLLFVRVARSGSFSRAGREVGLSQSSASRTIKALESELGATLLRRTTRAVVLTDAGREYLEHVTEILAQLDEVEDGVRGGASLRGTVRIALPASIAIRLVIPSLESFVTKHPAVRLDLAMADRRQDPVQEGIDVAISFGLAKESPANARHVATNKRILVAAPSYLANASVLTTPHDLAAHAVITGPVGRQTGAWTLSAADSTVVAQVQPRLTLNVNEAAIAAAVAGLGILSAGYWGCRAELESGALVRVLPEWHLSNLEMYVVLAAGKAAPRAARAVADHLVTSLRAMVQSERRESSRARGTRKQPSAR